MSDRLGGDALLDVGCFLDRFEVDSIQHLSWMSHVYLANKTHILPVRLLGSAEFGGNHVFVSARDYTRGRISFDGSQHEAFQLGLAAIKDSDLNGLSLFVPTGQPITEEEVDLFAAVAATVKIKDMRLNCRPAHLSPQLLRRLMFSFARIEELTLRRFNGNQLTDDCLRECGHKQIWRLYFTTTMADALPLAVSDEALLDYLYAPEYGMRKRQVDLSAFNASPQFVQKLVNRAQQATNIDRVDLDVKHLPLRSQQLGGLLFVENQGFAEYHEQLENGARITIVFGRKPVPSHYVGLPDFLKEEQSDDKFSFLLRM